MYQYDMTDKEIAQIFEISIDEWIAKRQSRAPLTLDEIVFLAVCFDKTVDELFVSSHNRIENRKIQYVAENKPVVVDLQAILKEVSTTKYDTTTLRKIKSVIKQLNQLVLKDGASK